MGLHIIVCIKSVVTRVTGTRIVRTPEWSEMNSFDRPVLESALGLKETHGGRVTALTMGPPDAGREMLLEAIAMGADAGVLLADPNLAGCDTLATSTALGAAVKSLEPFDLLLFGTRTSDSDTGQVGPQTAVLLDLPLVTYANTVEKNGETLIVSRTMDEFVERFEVALPAALTVRPSAADARDVPLQGIQTAFAENQVKCLSLGDVGLSPDQVGHSGSGTKVLSMKPMGRDKQCEFIDGTEEEKAIILLGRLKQIGLVG
jgi:electron transfer flavoprotein beta subunit